MNEEIAITPEIQRYANSIARKNGYGTATKIEFVKQLRFPMVGERIESGYRKKTTGQYVTNSYRKLCRGKGLYYQHAQTTVSLPEEILKNFS